VDQGRAGSGGAHGARSLIALAGVRATIRRRGDVARGEAGYPGVSIGQATFLRNFSVENLTRFEGEGKKDLVWACRFEAFPT
jgi:hypothetical protein